MPESQDKKKYAAFISYSHAADGKLAPALQSALQRIAKPWYKLRAMRVFRDETDLATSPGLWPTIVAALDHSDNLLLMASPEAAQSKWVNQEVDHWLHSDGRAKKLFIILTDGDIVWSARSNDFDWQRTTAIPLRLSKVFETEPLWVDVRHLGSKDELTRNKPDFKKAVAKLAAPIQGVDINKLVSEDYRQHRRTIRHALSAVLVLIVLSIFASLQWWRAEVRQRNLADSLAVRSWESSRAARKRSPLLSLHLRAEAAERAHDRHLRASVIREYEEGLPGVVLRAVLEDSTKMSGAVFNNDGSLILTWSGGGIVRLWEAESGTRLDPVFKHVNVSGAQFDNKGKRVLTYSRDGTLRLWETKTGRQVGAELKHGGDVWGCVFNEDDTQVLCWGTDGTARLWDSATGDQIWTPLKHGKPVWYAAFNRDESRILTRSEDGIARLWETETGKKVGPDLKDKVAIWGAIFSPTGTLVVTWGDTLQLWDAVTGSHTGPKIEHKGKISSASFSADGSRILTWSDDHIMRVWDLETGKRIGHELRSGPTAFRKSIFNKNGEQILVWSSDGTARLWNVATGADAVPPLRHDGYVNGAAFSRDGNHILTWSSDGTARLWNVATGDQIGPELKHNGPIWNARLNASENRILTHSEDGTVRLWEVSTESGHELRHERAIIGAIFSSGGKSILSWDASGIVRLWSAKSGFQVQVKHEGIYGAVFSTRANRILTWNIRFALYWSSHPGHFF